MIVHTSSISLYITSPAGSQRVPHSTSPTCFCSCSGNSHQRECLTVWKNNQFVHPFQIFCNFSPTQKIKYLDQIYIFLSLSLDEFFSHDFLKDPCSLPAEIVFGSHPPAPHTKSSPVPIKRHNPKGRSPHTSPRLSASPVSSSFT